VLTHRDVELLTFCATLKGAPTDVLARRFFAFHPVTGKKNKDPEHACRRRLNELRQLGYIAPTVARGERTLVTVTNKAVQALGLPRRPPVMPKGRSHHIATLRYIADLAERYEAQGKSVSNIRLEFQIRSEVQGGRQTRKGDDYERFPDAVFDLTEKKGDVVHKDEVAVEFVTIKYSDKDILEKHDAFRRFDNVVWAADSKSTARRVAQLTGRPAEVAQVSH